MMKRHRGYDHNTDSILVYFECQECEDLEQLYAESITYWVSAITEEICVEARARR